jgi:hypothetical protein
MRRHPPKVRRCIFDGLGKPSVSSNPEGTYSHSEAPEPFIA